jgi:hypothetical protein
LETKGIFETSPSPAFESSNISTINNNSTRKSYKSSGKNGDVESVESTKMVEPLNGKDEAYYAWICPACVSSKTRGSHLLIGLGIKIWWGRDMNYQKGLITSYDEPSGLFCRMRTITLYVQTPNIFICICTRLYLKFKNID